MSQGHHAQSHSKRWKQEEIAPVTPLTFLFSEASWVSPLREAAVYHYRSGMEAKEATTLCFSLNREMEEMDYSTGKLSPGTQLFDNHLLWEMKLGRRTMQNCVGTRKLHYPFKNKD